MPSKERRTTIRDVAQYAGTSPATVSRVLSGEDYPVAPELRNRVLNAAAQLDYQAPAVKTDREMGRGGRRSGRIIGVILPNVTNPFYSQALTGIENIARQRGYHAVVCNTLRDKTRERQYLEMLYDRGIRYVILSFVDFNADNISAFSQKGMCFVLLDQQVDDVDCGRVNFDMFGGAVLAVDYLIRMGHQRIALATTPLVRWTRVQVHRGYKAALEQAGLAYSQGDVFISSPEVEEEEEGYDILAGRQLAEMIAERRGEFSAILCVNDITCVGLIEIGRAHV